MLLFVILSVLFKPLYGTRDETQMPVLDNNGVYAAKSPSGHMRMCGGAIFILL